MTYYGSWPTHLRSAIQRGYPGEWRLCVTLRGSAARWIVSGSSISRSILLRIRQVLAARSQQREPSNLLGGFIDRTTLSFCERPVAKLHSSASISIRCARPKRWTFQLPVSHLNESKTPNHAAAANPLATAI